MKKMGLFVLVPLFLITGLVYAEDKGMVAVAAEGNTPAAEVSDMAARSPYFLIFDGAGALVGVIDNPYKEASRRAAASLVPFLAQKGVTFVVAGKFGQNMIRAMKERNIEHMAFQGSAEAAAGKVLGARK